MELKFIFPTEKHREASIEYVKEFYLYNSRLAGLGSLASIVKESGYEKWLSLVRSDADIANTPEPRVPSWHYFCVRESDGKIVGSVGIRIHLNDWLRENTGHISYAVRPTERRKHYGTKILKKALSVCGRMGVEEVLVSCHKDNPASAGVIRNCGGKLLYEKCCEELGGTIQMYVIDNTEAKTAKAPNGTRQTSYLTCTAVLQGFRGNDAAINIIDMDSLNGEWILPEPDTDLCEQGFVWIDGGKRKLEEAGWRLGDMMKITVYGNKCADCSNHGIEISDEITIKRLDCNLTCRLSNEGKEIFVRFIRETMMQKRL